MRSKRRLAAALVPVLGIPYSNLFGLQELNGAEVTPARPLKLIDFRGHCMVRMGLDFYCLPKHYAPLVGREIYERAFQILLPLADDIQRLYLGYREAEKDKDLRREKVDASLASADQFNRMAPR